MTKEELEKEAEQYAVENWEHYEEGQTDYKALKQAYLDSAEPREKRIAELEARCNELFLQTCEQAEKVKELEAEKKINAEIKARFVKCNTCTDEMKSKCLMFSENLCEGERCEELVDLMGLISKSELEKENAKAKELLKRYVPYRQITDSKAYKDLADETEQFLSEVEK